MANIVTKTLGYTAKNAVLTNAELDNNFININNELITKINKNTVEYPSFTQSLHKSPNAITSMFIYDTSKDSDGGAWTDKCQNTSWYNETLSGSWLGSKLSEIDARCLGATLGADIAVNGSFAADTNWTKGTGVTISNGTAVFTNVADNVGLTAAVAPLTTNLYYTISFTISGYVAGSVEILLGTTSVLFPAITNGTYSVSGLANSTAFVFRANGTSTYNVDNITIKPVTTLSTLPNDYFQLISDGKFYALSKNYLTTTATLDTQTQFLTAGTYTISSTTASSGSVAISGAATATHTAGTSTTFTVTTTGLVVFTVTGSVLTAQVELSSTATTYSANTSTTRYSETFRGNKKEFPKLSAIIAEAANVTIYDLTEKNNPMWMRIPVAATKPVYGETISSIAALNSTLSVGSLHATNGGLAVVSFISDNIKRYTTTINRVNQNIAQRNSALSYTLISSTGLSSIVVYDVSIGILPNALIDSNSGLLIPTLATANSNGINIIKDSGLVIKSSSTSRFHSVILSSNMITCGIYNTNQQLYAKQPHKLANSFSLTIITPFPAIPQFIKKIYKNKFGLTNFTGDNVYTNYNYLRTLHTSSRNKLMTSEIGSDYNTGYNTSYITNPLRAYLCGSKVGTINTSTELVTNGTFDNDTTGWTVNTPGSGTVTFTSVNGLGVLTANTSNILPSVYTIVNTIPENTYKLSAYLVGGGTNARCGINVYDATNSTILMNSFYPSSGQTFNIHFTAIGYTSKIVLSFYTGVYTGTQSFDNISVKESEINRLRNKIYADIYGTLTKSPVNTGTDLVAYSGFSNTNYIRENYSSDLAFGLLEFNINSWINIPVNNTTAGTICSRAYPNGASITLSNNSSNNLIATLYDGTTTKTVTTSVAYNTGTPNKISASYKFGKLGITVNGQEVATNLSLPLKALSGAWEEKAPQLNSQSYIQSLAAFNGKLYGGTQPNGKLFEWNGTNAWVEVAPQLNAQTAIFSLAVFNGKLYGGTGPNGRLFEWNGSNAWVEVAPQLNSQTYINSLAVFNGKLYGGTFPNGKLFEWNGTNAWVEVAPQLNSQTRIFSLAVFNGKLYGVTGTNGKLFEWNGTNAWVEVAPQLNSQTYIMSLAVFNGKLYGGTFPNGKLFEWNGSNAWIEVAPQLNSQTFIYSLAVYNGKLYGGTSSGGRLFEWNGTNAWIEVANKLNVETNIMCLTVFNNKIYGGTYPNAKLFEWNGYGTDATLTIGNSTDLTTPFPGSLSLLKISGTVPTKEQEIFMYEQEKQLFNENAKCTLPDDTEIKDVSYDEYSGNMYVETTTNLSEWNGLIRTNNTPVPSGTYSKIASTANIKLAARITTDPGVDVIIPKYNSKKKVADKDSYSKAITYPIETVDYIGGFTGTTTLNSNVITSNNLPTYDIIETIITGTNIPANTTIIAISGNDIYVSALATGSGSVNISFLEYNVPVGYITKYITKNGVYLTEGSTKDFTIDTDLFREIIKLVATPNYQDWIQLQITKKQ